LEFIQFTSFDSGTVFPNSDRLAFLSAPGISVPRRQISNKAVRKIALTAFTVRIRSKKILPVFEKDDLNETRINTEKNRCFFKNSPCV
jgi:hypothetical protein